MKKLLKTIYTKKNSHETEQIKNIKRISFFFFFYHLAILFGQVTQAYGKHHQSSWRSFLRSVHTL